MGGLGHSHARYFGRTVVADELVQESSGQASENWTYQVDRELTQMLSEFHIANQALDQQRANLAGWIERRAGDRADQDDDSIDNETDDDAREARGRAPINCRAKEGEDEDRGADGFGRDRDQHAAGGCVVANRAPPQGGRVVPDENDQREHRDRSPP